MSHVPSPISGHAHTLIIKVTFSFPKFVSTCKKSAHFISSFLRYSILELQDLKDHAHFDQHNPKIIKIIIDFPEFLSAHQKSVYSINSFLKYSQFYCPKTKATTPIFEHVHLNIFQSDFNIQEFVSTYKIQAFSSFCSRDIVDFEILPSEWSMSQESDFAKVWKLCKNTANNINFLYWPISEKNND